MQQSGAPISLTDKVAPAILEMWLQKVPNTFAEMLSRELAIKRQLDPSLTKLIEKGEDGA